MIYALFGYLWTKGNWRPEEGLGVNPNTVFLMIAWFFLCATGNLGPIANTTHGQDWWWECCLGLTPVPKRYAGCILQTGIKPLELMVASASFYCLKPYSFVGKRV